MKEISFKGLSRDQTLGFWRVFRDEYWGKNPSVIKMGSNSPGMSLQEMFDALKRVSPKGNTMPEVAVQNQPPAMHSKKSKTLLFVDEFNCLKGFKPYAPKPEDTSFEEYFSRLSKTWNERRLGIQIIDFQSFMNSEVWNRFRRFLNSLYSVVGIPVGRSEIELFFGNYLQTQIGIHKDTADVFLTVIAGKKKMRVWPYKIFKDRPEVLGTTDYQKYLDSSTLLEGGPGDILYWPSSYWHVAECDGNLSASLSLALFHGSLASMSKALIGESVGSSSMAEKINTLPFTSNLPSQISSLEKPAQAALAKKAKSVRKILESHWADKVTGYGFDSFPLVAVEKCKLKSKDVVQVDLNFPPEYKRIGKEILLACDGYSFFCAHDSTLLAMMKTLNSGSPFKVGDLLRDFEKIKRNNLVSKQSQFEVSGTLALLNTLVGLRFLNRVATD